MHINDLPATKELPATTKTVTAAAAKKHEPGTTDITRGESLPKFHGKVTSGEAHDGHSASITPKLDCMPPLRRAQYLQAVVRYIHAIGMNVGDKLKIR